MMELLDLVIEIENYLISKGLKASDTSVSELLDKMNNDGIEEM